MPSSFARRLGLAALLGAGISLTYVATLTMIQHKIIYFPRRYETLKNYYQQRQQMNGLITIPFHTSQGRQVTFYGAPTDSTPSSSPPHLWLLFGGNAALALDWADVLSHWIATHDAAKHTHFLLIDYPGYGYNEGITTPQHVLESSDAAVTALCQHLHITRSELATSWKIGVIGHSLGASAAMQWVNAVTPSHSSHQSQTLPWWATPLHPPTTLTPLPIHTIIMVSPFTSILDMAYALIGRIPGLHLLLKHNFDNTHATTSWYHKLASLHQHNELTWSSHLTIIHGIRDEIVPVWMGATLTRKLKEQPTIPGVTITYSEVISDHNSIILDAQKQLFDAMDQLLLPSRL